MRNAQYPIFTIGHSTLTLDTFLALLQKSGIEMVKDVRSTPHSRIAPQFNRGSLEGALHREGIHYMFLGRELGGRPADPSCYENGQVRYELLAQTELFRQGLEQVLQRAVQCRIALLCAEKEPLESHRALLIGSKLHELGVDVRHILSNGQIERHYATMERLLVLLKLPPADLFQFDKEERIAEAIALQSRKIAWTQGK